MRTIRIYQSNSAICPHLQLDSEASNHIVNVLRMREGDSLVLFDGKGAEFFATLTQIQKKSVSVKVETQTNIDRESPLHIHLAQGLAKGDKMDWVIQKAVELGVKEITPLITERSNVKLDAERWDKKLEHWQKVIISACEQCGRNVLPLIHKPLSFAKFLENQKAGICVMLQPNSPEITSLPESTTKLSLLIGPEGGFSEAEINLAHSLNCITLSLGPRILRTETAPLAAIAIMQAKWGDL